MNPSLRSDSGESYENTPKAELGNKKIVDNGKKIMGRPRNAWNQSRLRKVIRLYTMTSLKVEEIREVIRTKNFMPCKRDVQKQLQALFQTRPSKIRSGGNNTKLLRFFRECRPIDICDSSQLDYDSDEESMDIEDKIWNEKSSVLSAANNEWRDALSTITEVEPYKKWDSSVRQSRRRSLKLKVAHPKTKITPTEQINSTVTTTITAGDSSCPLISNMSEEDAMEGRRLITFITESHQVVETCQVSLVSIDSLRGRLAHKTESCVEDVISVLQNFSISGSTNASSNFGAGRSWKDSSRTSVLDPEAEQQVSKSTSALSAKAFVSQEQVLMHHELALPGHFASKSANPTLSAPRQLLTSLCRPAEEQALLSETELADWTSTLDDPDGMRIRCVDSFGHSILHIAAAAGQRPEFLLDMINIGADVHARNSGGETFLHLVNSVCSADRMGLGPLFLKLQMEGFDFSHRDDHGQTPLHLLSRQWVDKSALEDIVESLLSCSIAIPLSRDNLGRTILGQILDVGLKVPATEQLQEMVKAYDVAQTHEVLRAEEEQYKDCLPNYGSHTCIETMEDLQKYDLHANLLRTMRGAIISPQYEDGRGNNGLHCLAMVSLSLNIPHSLPSDQASSHTRREAHLSDLIEAKVDPDNYNKAGVTPLMAFIIHTRDDEDDETTIRILSRLHDAGANLNRRDRNGQTPLHLSVRLGKTAITRFLVHNGANIHVRENMGKSVIAIGKAYSERASSDVKLYAQIMMCIACMVDAGGVSCPTHSQEWAQK